MMVMIIIIDSPISIFLQFTTAEWHKHKSGWAESPYQTKCPHRRRPLQMSVVKFDHYIILLHVAALLL